MLVWPRKTRGINAIEFMATRTLLSLALLLAAQPCRADEANPYTITGQPSIFWRNGEWQTFQGSQWIPYSAPRQVEVATEPEMAIEPLYPQPENIQTNDYPDYYWGYGYPYGFRLHGHHLNKRVRNNNRKDDPFFKQPNAGLGSTTIGIGQPNGGIGQATIGIGQQSGGIGQTTIGIGQPTFTARAKITALGQPGTRPGHTRPESGQANAGTGQITTGAGQRTVATGQQSGTVRHASASHSEGQYHR